MDDRGAAILTVRADSQQYDRTADILHGHRLMETTQNAVEGHQSTETVTIERRQPSRSGLAGDQPFDDKIVEVTETREEPVVSKEVRAGEEVVVRKEQKDRIETIRDSVRETKVDVDRAAAGSKPSSKL